MRRVRGVYYQHNHHLFCDTIGFFEPVQSSCLTIGLVVGVDDTHHVRKLTAPTRLARCPCMVEKEEEKENV
jgi:hypothetical protein